jgi:transcriptional regulator with XRE-family HTH domain
VVQEVGMMPEFAGPMLRRWELGNALRRLREDRGMTIAEVTTAMKERYGSSFSPTKLSRMETAKRGVIPRDVHDLCVLYKVPDEEREYLVELAKSTRDYDKQHLDDVLARQGYSVYLALEQTALQSREYTTMYIPGLLQTAEYAQVVENLSYISPAYYNVREEDIPETTAGRVHLRVQRQEVLHRAEDPLRLHVLIDENALRRRLKESGVMERQLRYLLTESERPNISIQVLTFETGLYPGAESGYWTILDFPPDDLHPNRTVYLEAARGPVLFDRETEVAGMVAAFETLSHLALDLDRSRDFIEKVLLRHDS